MQYILTEEEYSELKKSAQLIGEVTEKQLQELCTKIANSMPAKRDWDREDKSPWGCILTEKLEHYCDECPVQDICPHTDKCWSQ